MLQLSGGNDSHTQSYVYRLDDSSQIGEVRRFALGVCLSYSASELRIGRIGIIITELGTNIVKYAPGGKLVLRWVMIQNAVNLEILSLDHGPGFSDPEVVMADGYSTGSTPGNGLGAVRRLADFFDIYSQPGKGTAILSIISMKDENQSHENFPFYHAGVNVAMSKEEVCGDAWAVSQGRNSFTALIVDGLGHGPQAYAAAAVAIEVFNEVPDLPLDALLRNIHARLRGTRGAAVFLARYEIEKKEIHFVGAGNIRTFIQSSAKPRTLITQNGTAGLELRTTRILTEPWDGEGFLILHTDGVTSHWGLSPYANITAHHPALMAGIAYRDHNRNSDDSTILVIGRKR